MPGSLLLASILLLPDRFLMKFTAFAAHSPWLWLLILGATWIAGFAIQALGELTGLVRIYPKAPTRAEARDKAIARRIQVYKLNETWATQERERYVILKELSGNVALALLIALVYLGFAILAPRTVPAVRLALLLLASSILFWYNREVLGAQEDFEVAATQPPPQPTATPRKSRA